MLEGTKTEPDIQEGKLEIRIKNTTAKEMARLYRLLDALFKNGVTNTRNGRVVLHFNDQGELRGIDKDVSTWREGKEVVTRVAMYEEAIVEIKGS